MSKTAIIIPSRYASTRLHAKPLIEVEGKPIIQWVYEKASAVKQADEVFYGHIGLYGYKREALFKMTSLPQTMLEKTESLEQLRALQSGMRIITSVVNFKPIGIDTKEDVEEFKKALNK